MSTELNVASAKTGLSIPQNRPPDSREGHAVSACGHARTDSGRMPLKKQRRGGFAPEPPLPPSATPADRHRSGWAVSSGGVGAQPRKASSEPSGREARGPSRASPMIGAPPPRCPALCLRFSDAETDLAGCHEKPRPSRGIEGRHVSAVRPGPSQSDRRGYFGYAGHRYFFGGFRSSSSITTRTAASSSVSRPSRHALGSMSTSAPARCRRSPPPTRCRSRTAPRAAPSRSHRRAAAGSRSRRRALPTCASPRACRGLPRPWKDAIGRRASGAATPRVAGPRIAGVRTSRSEEAG